MNYVNRSHFNIEALVLTLFLSLILELLKPDIDPYHLKNSFGYGMCYANGDSDNHSCDKTSISFGIALEDPERGRIGNINVHTKISNLQVDGGTELKFDLNWLNALTIADLLARPQCLTLPATEFNLYGFNASVGMLELQLDVNLNSEDGGSQFYTYQTEDSIELAHVISALLSKGAVWIQEVWGDSFISNIVGESNTCTTPVNPNRKHAATHSKSSAGFFTFIIVLVFVAGNAWLILRGMKKDDDKGEISYDALHSQEVENDEVVASEEQEFTR